MLPGTGKMQRRDVKFYKSKRINACLVWITPPIIQ
jgi:hypothetical protein